MSQVESSVAFTTPGALKKMTREQIREKLITLFAGETGIARDRLDLSAPIGGYGLDSVSVASVLGEVETWSGRRIDPGLLWKQPSIATLVDHLSEARPAPAAAPVEATSPIPGLEELDARFQALADAEIDNPFFRTFEGLGADTIASEDRSLVNFASYNYLGLAGHEDVKRAAKDAIDRCGTSVSASRLSSGERAMHLELERALARLSGTDDALAFVGGYATNVSVIGHLFSAEDLIVYDSLMHNSAITGARLAGSRCLSFPHNDLAALDRLLTRERGSHRQALVLAEGVYSTDGDIPDLQELVRLKKHHRAWLMVDEAHSIGVLGPRGRGLAEHCGVPASEIDIVMGTLSKSLASCGGYVAGRGALIRYLRYTCPGFIFSAGISPANAAAALRAIGILEAEPERVVALRGNAATFISLAKARGLDTGLSAHSGVAPVMVGNDADAIRLSNELFEAGINVQPLVAPAVDKGKARLRFFLSSLHTREQMERAVDLTATLLEAIKEPLPAVAGR
jgi:8-amino-7-oxononanoate synthase